MLAVVALDKSLSMVWWLWHISVTQLYCCWSMAVSFWVASITVCVVLVCRRENVGAWIRATNEIKFLVKLGKSGNEISEMLVQVYEDNAMKKAAVYSGWNVLWGKRKCHWRREIRAASNKQNWRKHCKSSSNFAWKSSTDCQEHSRESEYR